jgi:hypothetical protein
MNDAHVILLLYLDDLFVTGAKPLIIQCERELAFEFDMKEIYDFWGYICVCVYVCLVNVFIFHIYIF